MAGPRVIDPFMIFDVDEIVIQPAFSAGSNTIGSAVRIVLVGDGGTFVVVAHKVDRNESITVKTEGFDATRIDG